MAIIKSGYKGNLPESFVDWFFWNRNPLSSHSHSQTGVQMLVATVGCPGTADLGGTLIHTGQQLLFRKHTDPSHPPETSETHHRLRQWNQTHFREPSSGLPGSGPRIRYGNPKCHGDNPRIGSRANIASGYVRPRRGCQNPRMTHHNRNQQLFAGPGLAVGDVCIDKG